MHLLPAPVFRMTADLQSRRRLGLTATLVREDGREGDVFSLIGPKRYDAPWRDIEQQGWIAPAECVEVRVTLTDNERMGYAVAEAEERYRVASTARTKLARREGDPGAPPRRARARHRRVPRPAGGAGAGARRPGHPGLHEEPRARGAVRHLPPRRAAGAGGEQGGELLHRPARRPASPCRCPGTFGSRQEEAQRLGRLLRPKGDGRQAHFYSVVSRDTLDTDYAAHRQRFLAEQGYAYRIVDADDLLGPAVPDVS